MRAILIDTFNKEVKEVDLPMEANAFMKEIRSLLRTDAVNMIRNNELLTVMLDGAAVIKGSPAFWSGLCLDCPIYGNALLVGRSPFTDAYEDLYRMYTLENHKSDIKWCDEQTAEQYRGPAIAFALQNRS
ncbi:hypothetical protein ACQKLP_10845 [Chitinophaga sp. NPDC101104]|uniref:hypothetical protein n=1 Tax=Chitinophaga sp. NPDC101104 TaxID=3390561 RepID=UPI003D038B49